MESSASANPIFCMCMCAPRARPMIRGIDSRGNWRDAFLLRAGSIAQLGLKGVQIKRDGIAAPRFRFRALLCRVEIIAKGSACRPRLRGFEPVHELVDRAHPPPNLLARAANLGQAFGEAFG